MDLADILKTTEDSQHDDADCFRYAAKIPIVFFRRFDLFKEVDEIHSLHAYIISYFRRLKSPHVEVLEN